MSQAIQTTQTNGLTPFEPANLEQALSLAGTLSKSGIIPEALRNKPADVLVVLMTGRELGIGPMQALRGISVINGKAVIGADLMVSQCLRHRDVCAFFRLVESTDVLARYSTQRAGSEPVTMEWTIEQAKKAGLAGKGPWQAHPAAMLRARCSSALARAVYPDLVGGMYDHDEGAEMAPKSQPETVYRPEPAAPKALRGGESKPVGEVIDALKEEKGAPEAPARTADTVWKKFEEAFGEDAKVEWRLSWQRAGLPEVRIKDLTQDQLEALEAAMFMGEHP